MLDFSPTRSNSYKTSLLLQLFCLMAAQALFSKFLPALRLQFFIPLLVLCYYRYSLIVNLWLAVIVGLVLDLSGSTQHLGLYAFSYLLASRILYAQQQTLSADRHWTLPILTAVFSVFVSAFYMLLCLLLEQSMQFDWRWMICDIGLMPLCDGAYAFIFFTVPLLLTAKLKKTR